MARRSLMARNVFLSCLTILLFAQAVVSESTDATKSTASGNGLQYATAGVQASFTVTAKVSFAKKVILCPLVSYRCLKLSIAVSVLLDLQHS